jgi:hypothetical protein
MSELNQPQSEAAGRLEEITGALAVLGINETIEQPNDIA